MARAICDGTPTLVHCVAGLNRSGLVSALALGELGLTGENAIRLLRLARSEAVLGNPVFARYVLQRYPAAYPQGRARKNPEVASLPIKKEPR